MAKNAKQGGKAASTAVAKKSDSAPAIIQNAPVVVGDRKFRTKLVTVPRMLIKEGMEVAVRIDGPMHEALVKQERKGQDGSDMKPMKVCNVTLLETGEVKQLICGEVVVSSFTEQYPNDTYVGKLFVIANDGKVEGRRYMAYRIAELIDDSAEGGAE